MRSASKTSEKSERERGKLEEEKKRLLFILIFTFVPSFLKYSLIFISVNNNVLILLAESY